MGQILVLALLSSLNPTLTAMTTVMLLLPNPKLLMFGYLAGALLTSVTLGMIIVFALPEASVTSTTRHVIGPGVDIGLGVIGLLISYVVRTGRLEPYLERRRTRRAQKGPSKWQQQIRKGSPRTTFVIGALFTLPGASYLAGLTEIHQRNYPTAETFLIVIGFNLVMLWMIEVPLGSFIVAPGWTPTALDRAKKWVGRHAHAFAVNGSALIGASLLIKGIAGLV